jgi:hypothetical protein
MSETKQRPRSNKARPGDTVMPFKCPDCGAEHFLWIDVQSIPELERDELGQVILDEQGRPKEKMRLSHSYIQVPRIHPAWSPEMEEELKILYERSKAERDYALKKKKPEIPMEIAA